MGQVRERHIKNSHTCTMFYNIPCIRNQVTFRQLTYAGKILCREKSHIPTIFLTAWYDNPRKRGGQLMMNSNSLVRKLQLIIPEIDDAKSVSTSGFCDIDTTCLFLLLATLKHPANMTPNHPSNKQEANPDAPQPTPFTPSPPWLSHSSQPPHSPSRSNMYSSRSEGFYGSRPFNTPHPLFLSPTRSPPRNWPPSPPPRSRTNYDKGGILLNVRDSIGVLGLEMGVTVWELTCDIDLWNVHFIPTNTTRR